MQRIASAAGASRTPIDTLIQLELVHKLKDIPSPEISDEQFIKISAKLEAALIDKFKKDTSIASIFYKIYPQNIAKRNLYNLIVDPAHRSIIKEIAKNIKSLNIPDEELRYQLAKYFVVKYPLSGEPIILLSVIKNLKIQAAFLEDFKITGDEKLFNLAKLCSTNHEVELRWLKNFKIPKTDKDKWVEIIKLASKHSFTLATEMIKEFEIADKKQLFEIAWQCGLRDPYATIVYIQDWGIVDEGDLFELAKLCAKNIVCFEEIEKISVSTKKNYSNSVCSMRLGVFI